MYKYATVPIEDPADNMLAAGKDTHAVFLHRM